MACLSFCITKYLSMKMKAIKQDPIDKNNNHYPITKKHYP